MKNLKENFYKYQAQTTRFASGFEVDYAKGAYIYGKDGKAYLDFVAGVSVNTLGHSNRKINDAIKQQVDRYMHVAVYGEYAQEQPVELCKRLVDNTPEGLEQVYLVNSGTEAVEASLKLAKRFTGRQQIVSFRNAYHGNTHGSLSVSGDERKKAAFRPLLPEVYFIEFNREEDLQYITTKTAGVIVETIRGASGFRLPENDYLIKLKNRCDEVGALLIFDEIQPGFGRTGKLFAFEHYGVTPHIVAMGKGMANGLPIGAFMSSHKIMSTLKENPQLGHITTFGGNPVIAAAANALLDELLTTSIMQDIDQKENLFREMLQHPKIKTIHGRGLMLAPELSSPEYALRVAEECMNRGLILFWLMYSIENLRITPPLNITNDEIEKGCRILLSVLDELDD
ncbi:MULTISPECIES: aspartate aminotransferase family protein [Weeksella]|uniref:Acetylornithine transaminase n=1 Tax=Weeksella virosa (strain ATCC 43766 / DSM 16922 / JCM 21250 / CCUG 30538 / CDC 9751 / IAM 14551 / NBRC 16016 / NCTC 11634 / CL345/78) TaxID=865938 RepID=F0P231_WEEVC|nr:MULTISPECIES: aspartate aminotransferase family protein [Weeksella]ADX68759.1 Acetylornithine transaminase [Weeksella virosa DSM 16922]MDK7374708.1 aspartate aminotransferase family protein [Weeksella virosa]MDK7675201.1 aspartate aminotransferase family protein [Weeksella virosa]OFM85387.1 aminotransferase class III [Weeksella sp. HMSC059D05]SUP55110.1 Acetylornithine aminotransferase [Weeksella virosa]